MKQKTKWVDITDLRYHNEAVGVNFGKVFFGLDADVRWLNVYRMPIGTVALWKGVPGGKIIGDE